MNMTDETAKWVPVRERLPEEAAEYVVMIEGGANATVLLWDGTLWFEEDHEGWQTYYRVTHWMPMPEPPGEG